LTIGTRYPLKIRIKIHVLRHGQVLIQAEFLRHISDATLNLYGIDHAIETQNGNSAGRGDDQARCRTDQGSFPGPVRSHKSGYLSAQGIQRNVAKGLNRRPLFGGKLLC